MQQNQSSWNLEIKEIIFVENVLSSKDPNFKYLYEMEPA
jgi:hypothetical protein